MMSSTVVKRYKKLSILTACLLGGLLMAFYFISIILTFKIFSQVVNIQEYPFPVVIAAGEVQTSVNQMRMLSERLEYIHTGDVIDKVEEHYIEIEEKCTQPVQDIVDRYLHDQAESEGMQDTFQEVMAIQYGLLDLCRQLNITAAEINEYNQLNVIPLLDKLESHLESIITNASKEFYDFTGSALLYRNVMLLLCSLINIGVISALVIYLYIIHKKELEEKRFIADMEVALAAAKTANAAKSRFLSSMSHDIRTPMNAIIGMTAVAGTNIDDPARVKDCLGKISTSSKLLLGLINDVLDMSKIESGKVIISEDIFSLSDLFQSVVTIIQPQIKSKQHMLRVSITDVKNEQVIGDVLRLQQVLMNLLSNAVKFTSSGGEIKLMLLQEQSLHHDYGNYTFIVSDNGIGMSEEFMTHIFEPFEREESSTVRYIEGTGLGLAITKNIVDMMGGQLKVESQPGMGTVFTVNLQLKMADEYQEKIENGALRDLRVLVVDDEQDICENTVSVLQEIGMVSEWVLSGLDAVEYVKKAHDTQMDYHAIILDWKMPDMDGLETTRQIRKVVGRELPIIILSAYDWSDIEEEARQAGVTAFLTKPLFKSRLYYVLSDVFCKEDQAYAGEMITNMLPEGRRVLVVEDNEINVEIVEMLLESYNIESQSVSDGQQAVDAIKDVDEDYYDMILMDIQMPVMDGYTATLEIRSFEEQTFRKPIPIVALSANAFAEDIIQAKAVGMNDYITKPINSNELFKVLNDYLK